MTDEQPNVAPSFEYSDCPDENGRRMQGIKDRNKSLMLRMVSLLRSSDSYKMDTVSIAKCLGVGVDTPRIVARQYEKTFSLHDYNINDKPKFTGQRSGSTSRCSCTLHPHLQYR